MESFQEWLDFVLDMPLPDDSAAVKDVYKRQAEHTADYAGADDRVTCGVCIFTNLL